MTFRIELKRALFATAILFGLFGVGYLLVFSANGSVEVPELFRITRERAAGISRDIVVRTTNTVEKIGAMQNVGEDRTRGVVLVREARRSNAGAYGSAFDLSEQLKVLAQTIAGISSARSQRIASEAIATELALVSEFIGYTQDVEILLNRLQAHFASGADDVYAQDPLLQKINARVRRINDLNKEFEIQMRAFDRSL